MVLLDIPAFAKLFIVFVVLVICIRKKLPLTATFLVAPLLTSLVFAFPPLLMLKSALYSAIASKTLGLAFVVALILILSHAMQQAGQMERMVKSFQQVLARPRLSIFALPAFIGLLPMPGGAVFSAPMVKELSSDSQYTPNQLAFFNYWFRHVWEYWWPLYPGVLLVCALADIELSTFVLLLLPMSATAIFFGCIQLKRSISPNHNTSKLSVSKNAKALVFETAPILITIIGGLGLGALFALLWPSLNFTRELGLSTALVIAIWWVWRQNKTPHREMFAQLRRPQPLELAFLIICVMIFRGILEDCQAVALIVQELTAAQVPLVLVVVLIPFLVGMATGITIAFVGSAFPILISLINTAGAESSLLPLMMLGKVSGIAGVMLSPLHLCLMLSNEYFGANLSAVYKHLWWPCVGLIITALAYFALIEHCL